MDRAPFAFHSTASLARNSGFRADNLRALLRGVQRVPGGSLFYHLHHALFRRHFTTAEFMNDFARWAWVTLREERLAERLAALDPMEFTSLSAARTKLAAEIEASLGSAEYVQHVPEGAQFYFLEAQTFVFSTGVVAKDPAEFATKIRTVGADVVFHHLVGAPIRLGRRDNDFSAWLDRSWGAHELAARLRELSPYASDLYTFRDRIGQLVAQHA